MGIRLLVRSQIKNFFDLLNPPFNPNDHREGNSIQFQINISFSTGTCTYEDAHNLKYGYPQ